MGGRISKNILKYSSVNIGKRTAVLKCLDARMNLEIEDMMAGRMEQAGLFSHFPWGSD